MEEIKWKKILDGYWIFEEGNFTNVEFGHRIEKVEVAYAWQNILQNR